jgi:hypothetical protein
LKALSQQAGEFRSIVREVVENLLHGGTKRSKGGMVTIARDLALEEFPKVLYEVQVRRVGRQIE